MNIRSSILYKLTKAVCEYLSIEEDLFFCSLKSTRIIEARRYVCYLGIKCFGIDSSSICKFLNYSTPRTVQDHHRLISGYHASKQDLQVVKDIENLENICYKISPIELEEDKAA